MEIPKGGHRLSFFISYHVVSDDDEADQGNLALIIL
jgi:hypothetical protein